MPPRLRRFLLRDEEYQAHLFLGEGICLACGAWSPTTEEARGADCEACDEAAVYAPDVAQAMGNVSVEYGHGARREVEP